eukprot:13845376-Ditylum_brightwellii.AAC.1
MGGLKRRAERKAERKGEGGRECKKKSPPSSPPSKKRANKKNKKGSKEKKDGQIYDDDMSRPAYINVGSPMSKFDPVIDVADASFAPRKT